MRVIFDKPSAKQWRDPVFGASDATLMAVSGPILAALMEAYDYLRQSIPDYDKDRVHYVRPDVQFTLV
jgi:hypothetical protein